MDARWIVGLLALAVLLGAAPVGAADPPSPAPGQGPPPRPVRLVYQRGPGAERCPEEQAFRDAAGANAISSADLFAPDVAARLAVTLRRRGYGYEGTLDLYDAAGALLWTRTLPPPNFPPSASCPSLVESLALSATNYIDPAVPLPLAPLPVAPPIHTPRKPDEPPPPPVERWPFAFRAGAAVVVDVGTAPRPAVGLSLGLGFRVSWFSLEMEGRWDPPAGASIDGADVSTARFVGVLLPCGHTGYFVGCALAELGPIRGTITAPGIIPGTHETLYVAVGGRFGAEVPLVPHRLFLRPAVDLLIAAQSADFRIALHPQWAAPTVAAGFGLGLFASF